MKSKSEHHHHRIYHPAKDSMDLCSLFCVEYIHLHNKPWRKAHTQATEIFIIIAKICGKCLSFNGYERIAVASGANLSTTISTDKNKIRDHKTLIFPMYNFDLGWTHFLQINSDPKAGHQTSTKSIQKILGHPIHKVDVNEGQKRNKSRKYPVGCNNVTVTFPSIQAHTSTLRKKKIVKSCWAANGI